MPAAGHQSRWLGDCINWAVLLNLLVYVLVVGANHYRIIDVLSPSFTSDGFCVSNKQHSIYVQSHALCLYGDSAFAALLLLITLLDKAPHAARAVQTIRPHILGVVVHGAAHMFLAHKFENASPEWLSKPPQQRSPELSQALALFGVLWMLWFAFMRSFHGWSTTAVLFATGYTAFHFTCVPGLFAFTYVNCLLILHNSLNNIFFLSNELDELYAATSLVAVPVSVIAWLEATQCEQLIRPIGGHLVYDLSIPVSILILYAYVRSIPSEKPDGKGE